MPSANMKATTEKRVADNASDERAAQIIKDFQRRQMLRFNFEAQWSEISERMDPVSRKNFSVYNPLQTKGEKRTFEIYDSRASRNVDKFASIMESLLTPRNQTWHKLQSDNEDLNKSRAVQLYFEQATKALFKYRYAPKANFDGQNYQTYHSLGLYGTSAMFIDRLYGEAGVRYKNCHISQMFFRENHQGIINDALRYYPMTAVQAVQKWGSSCPEALVNAAKQNPDQDAFIIHAVYPNENIDPERLDHKGMPYNSCYVSVLGNKLITEGGYNSFPFSISRYKQGDNEIYGRSPAMQILPDVKTLNEFTKTLLRQGHRALDPVLLVHNDGIMDGFSLIPGAMNTGGVNAAGQPLVHALPTGNIQASEETMKEPRDAIDDVFLVALFQILLEGPERTATEVLELAKEKNILVGPTVGRQQTEKLGPMIERELDLLAKQGLLPPQPQELKQASGNYNVVYDSPLSRAQRAEEAAGASRTIEQAINVAATAGKPEVLDHFNFDQIIPAMADINAVPPSWLNDPKTISQIRKARSDQMSAQQLQQALPGTAAMVKSVAMAKNMNK